MTLQVRFPQQTALLVIRGLDAKRQHGDAVIDVAFGSPHHLSGENRQVAPIIYGRHNCGEKGLVSGFVLQKRVEVVQTDN